MIAVTGATGQLGQLVIQHLLTHTDADTIVALVRHPEKAQGLRAMGVEVREADYSKPDTLNAALSGIKKLLLISSSEVGQRTQQHKNVIDAAKLAGVEQLCYTSLLHADRSPLMLAGEHTETETYLKQSGVPYVLLRNGWYTENYLASMQPAVAHGAFIGCAGEGRISSASRSDYAEAAAVVLCREVVSGTVYELAGDDSYTLAELSDTISRVSGKPVPYVNMTQTDYASALEGAGIPAPFAAVLADSDAGAAQGALFDDSHTLSQLIGHPTTDWREMVKLAR